MLCQCHSSRKGTWSDNSSSPVTVVPLRVPVRVPATQTEQAGKWFGGTGYAPLDNSNLGAKIVQCLQQNPQAPCRNKTDLLCKVLLCLQLPNENPLRSMYPGWIIFLFNPNLVQMLFLGVAMIRMIFLLTFRILSDVLFIYTKDRTISIRLSLSLYITWAFKILLPKSLHDCITVVAIGSSFIGVPVQVDTAHPFSQKNWGPDPWATGPHFGCLSSNSDGLFFWGRLGWKGRRQRQRHKFKRQLVLVLLLFLNPCAQSSSTDRTQCANSLWSLAFVPRATCATFLS